MEYIDKVGLISIKDHKAIVALNRGQDKFYIAGGKREAGETDEQCLIREIKEELGVDLKPDSIKYYGTFEDQAHGKPEGVMIRMICYTADFTGEPTPSREIEKLDYLGYDRKLDTGTVAHKIFDDLKEKGLIE